MSAKKLPDLRGFNEVKIEIRSEGKTNLTPVCHISFPLMWYLDEGETVIGKLLMNGKEVGMAVISLIFKPQERPQR